MSDDKKYQWDAKAVVAQLDNLAPIRETIRDHNKLIVDTRQDPALPIKPGIKILKQFNCPCAVFAVGMRDSECQRATPIDVIIDVLKDLLGKHNVRPEAKDLHTQSWDLKNLLTYMRGLWVRQKERPISEIALLVSVL